MQFAQLMAVAEPIVRAIADAEQAAAAEFGVSADEVHRLWCVCRGNSPEALTRAAALLQQGGKDLSTIADESGANLNTVLGLSCMAMDEDLSTGSDDGSDSYSDSDSNDDDIDIDDPAYTEPCATIEAVHTASNKVLVGFQQFAWTDAALSTHWFSEGVATMPVFGGVATMPVFGDRAAAAWAAATGQQTNG